MLPHWLLDPLLGGAVQIGASLALVGVALGLHALTLARLAGTVRAGRCSRLDARRRLHASIPPIFTPVALLIIAGAATPFVIALAAPPDGVSIGMRIWELGLGVILPVAAYDAALQGWLLPRSRRVLLGGAANPARVPYILRALALRYGLALTYLAAVGLLNLSPALDPWRWTLPAAVALVTLVRGVTTHQLLAWISRLTPIEEAEWTDLAPRISSWAARAGVRIERVYVQRVGDLGTAGAGIYGLFRHRMYIGAFFLEAADWRQRDAVICHELAHVRRRDVPRRLALNVLAGALLAASFAVLRPGDLSLLFTSPIVATAAELADLRRRLISLIVAGVLYLAWLALTSLYTLRKRAAELGCDRYAALTTGDPLALSVALLSLETLVGATRRRSAGSHPSYQRRLQALDAMRRQPGPFAPWAFRPVPAKFQYSTPNGAHFTLPLDQAPPAPPVPPAPWPISSPPQPAAPQPVAMPVGPDTVPQPPSGPMPLSDN